MFYSVKYRRKGQVFFRKLKNVEADGFLENNAPLRFFILADKGRVEIPIDAEFYFSKDRFLAIKARMESEAGQKIPIDGG